MVIDVKWKIPLFKSYWEEDDIKSVENVIRRGTHWADGPEIKKFEEKISKFVHRKYTAAFNSGTSALHSLLLAYGIAGKEVIVPSFTFIATANTVVLAGGKPVFAEIEEETFGLDADDVENRITKNTKAIISVHYGGCPCRDIEELKGIAKEHGLVLIEDAAEAFGSTFNGKMLGTFSDSAIFSFCQNKIITTGEGGAAVTDSNEIYEKLKLLRSHGRLETSRDGYFSSTGDTDYTEAGYNYRIPTICAAIGLSQMDKIDKIIKKRISNANYMNDKLSNVKGVTVPIPTKNFKHVYQLYTIKLENDKIRDSLQKHLAKNGVMTKVYFNPIHLKKLYRERYGYKEGDLPITEDISRRVLTLPMYPDLSKEEMDHILDKIRLFFKRQFNK